MSFHRTSTTVLALTAAMLTTSSPAQSLKLIPMPREIRPAPTQPLSGGIQIHCADPCAPEDAFAIEDLKAYFLSLNIPVNNSAPSTILVTRYGSPNSKSIYTSSLPTGSTETDFGRTSASPVRANQTEEDTEEREMSFSFPVSSEICFR